METDESCSANWCDIMRASRKRSGYVLIAVLATMVLVVTVLSALSRTSLRRALAAADAQVRLQQRVGSDSIEAALLPKAGKVFDQLQEAAEANSVTSRFPTTLRGSVTTAGVTFDVLLSDEDAKLNLNAIYHSIGQQRTEMAIREVSGALVAQSLRLVPAAVSETKPTNLDGEIIEAPPRVFRSWGEVFDLSRLSASVGDDAALPNLTTELTCWGGGALNLKRASDEAIVQTAACVLSQAGADRLVRRYRENPMATMEILARQATDSDARRRALQRLLGETSNHFSIWIDASASARRSKRTFSAYRQTEDGTIANERFAF